MTEKVNEKTAIKPPPVGAPGHEQSEMNVRPIVWFMVWLGVATIVICLITAGLFNLLNARAEKTDDKGSPLASERQKLPPEPRLQLAPATEEQLESARAPNLQEEHPLREMKRLREEEDAKLNSYGWVDEKAGVVRIPIDEAKKLILQKGIPTRQR